MAAGRTVSPVAVIAALAKVSIVREDGRFESIVKPSILWAVLVYAIASSSQIAGLRADYFKADMVAYK